MSGAIQIYQHAAPGRQPAPVHGASGRPVFAFDLDGTVTSVEILPRLAARIGLEKEMSILTRKTLNGEIPFEVSFRRRFAMLSRIPLPEIHAVIERVPLNRDIESFIAKHSDDCAIVTGNLDVWIAPLLGRLGCRAYCSASRAGGPGIRNAAGLELVGVLDKGEAILDLKALGRPVVAIGESVGDIAMFREADLSLAFAGVHQPAPELLPMAEKVFHCGAELCAFLKELRLGRSLFDTSNILHLK